MQNNTLPAPYDAKVLGRFWPKVNKTDGCWEWNASRYQYGHGQFSLNGRGVPAHRFSYELANGPIPSGLVVDHICHNPPCVNPDHLRAVTTKQNIENQVGANVGSKSGVRGACWHERRKKWRVFVKHNKVNVWGGGYDTLAEAESAAVELRNKLFTCNDVDRVAV